MNLINKKDNIFGDEIAFVEQYDFSTANMSEENIRKQISKCCNSELDSLGGFKWEKK